MSGISAIRSASVRTAITVVTVPVAAGSLGLIFVPCASASVDIGTAVLAAPGATASSPVPSGGSSTPFTVALPPRAACPGDTAHDGYRVYSYLVPKGTDLSSVTFVEYPSTGYGLVFGGRYYGAVNTALHTGQIIGIPNDFEWGALVGRRAARRAVVGRPQPRRVGNRPGLCRLAGHPLQRLERPGHLGGPARRRRWFRLDHGSRRGGQLVDPRCRYGRRWIDRSAERPDRQNRRNRGHRPHLSGPGAAPATPRPAPAGRTAQATGPRARPRSAAPPPRTTPRSTSPWRSGRWSSWSEWCCW